MSSCANGNRFSMSYLQCLRWRLRQRSSHRRRKEILAGVEHVLSDAAGEWRVSIVGSRADDNWEMKVEGRRGFERSYTLVGKAGEHQPEAIRNVLIKLLPASTR